MRNSDEAKIRLLILICFFQMFSALEIRAQVQIDKSRFPLSEIIQYIDQNDTSNLTRSLAYLDKHFDKYESDELLEILHAGERHSEKKDLYKLVEFYTLIRKYYMRYGNTSKTLEYALKCYNIQKTEEGNPELFWLLVDVGNIFFEVREYDPARKYYQKALKLAAKLDDSYGLSVIHLNLGLVAEQKKEFQVALREFKQSGYFRELSGNKKLMSSTYVNLANIFFRMKQIDSAFYYTRQAEYYYESIGEKTDLLIEVPAMIQLGYYRYYASLNNYTKANPFLKKTREYIKENRLLGPYIGSYEIERNLLIEAGMYEKAIASMLEILPLVSQKKLLLHQKDIYEALSKIYTKLKQYEKASEAFQNYLMTEHEMANSSVQPQFNTVSAMAQAHEDEVRLQKMRRNLEIGEMINASRIRQRNISFFVLGIAIIGIVFLTLLLKKLKDRGKKLESMQLQLLEQNNSIKIQSEELKKSNQIKDKIFSVIAHDIRNPLNRLLVELALIKKEIPDDKKHVSWSMENTLKETIDLFERLLQWSRRDNKQIVYSPSILNLSESTDKVISFYMPEIQSNNITVIDNTCSLNAFADSNVLLTLLRNLLGNAIKAVGINGKIEITCRKLDDEKLEIVFMDSGTGFSKRILNEFNDDNSTESGGEGAGLMLCKMLARYNGWPIHLSNNSIHGGAKIKLVIPAYREKQLKHLLDSKEISDIHLSDSWKKKLHPITRFKLYQTSELRKFLNSMETDDAEARNWILSAREAIRENNMEAFKKLIGMLN